MLLDILELVVPQDRPERQDLLDGQDGRDPLAVRGILEHLAQPVQLEALEQQASEVQLVLRVLPGLQEPVVQPERPVWPVRTVRQVLADRRVRREGLERLDRLGSLERLELLD